MGKAKPSDCPLFGKVCTPMSPEGACMVSEEGSCFNAYLVRR
ncbi:MAG: hydrogenase formation protein HypD, partial [Pseudobutyrivibrio sp.]|nr:hydrogenase formation protein HypD [Pseudobutyrivibrio sp.]